MKFVTSVRYCSKDWTSETPTFDQEYVDYLKKEAHREFAVKMLKELEALPKKHAAIKIELTDTLDDYWESMERHVSKRSQEYSIVGEITPVIYKIYETLPPPFHSMETVVRVAKLNKFQKLMVRVFRMKKETW